MNIQEWMKNINKKDTMLLLSFPAMQYLNTSVDKLVHDSELQAQAMCYVNERCDMSAIIGLMDLSVEAEAFGANVRCNDEEVPTIIGAIIKEQKDVDDLEVPSISMCRTNTFVEAVRKVSSKGIDKPILPGIIGPFSLAGRLMDVSEAMIYCYDEPEMVHSLLNKVTAFLIEYGKAFKKAGASGIVMAEPLAGILSPGLVQEFSCDYVKRIVDALSDDDFIVVYHNCGNNTSKMIPQLLSFDAAIYHFGNSVNMIDILENFPSNKIVMGNLDPVALFKDASPQEMAQATKQLMIETKSYSNFILSSGCDIPPTASWDNIDIYMKTVRGE